MKIAFCIRPNYDSPMGGDAIQMLKTKKYLEKNYDVLIDIITDPKEITTKYSIVHVFNFSTYRTTRKFVKKANEYGIPVVSSPIYWDYSYASTGKLFYLFGYLKYINEFTINIFKNIILFLGYILSKPVGISFLFKQNAKWLFEHSNIIAPNSIEEANLLLAWINKKDVTNKIRIVYNATDIEENKTNTQISEKLFFNNYAIPKDYILQVGRIEYCKNQLNLIVALKDNPEIPIVFVGRVIDLTYYKKLKNISTKRGNVYFIDAVSHTEISTFFKYAKLHVLLSLRESPGLVNIESLSNGCPIVISDERFLPVNTYFSNQPYVVNPLNIKEVKDVILNAYKNRVISPFDFEKFSWDTVSKQTYNIYSEILKNDTI